MSMVMFFRNWMENKTIEFYILELSVESGGSSKHVLHVLANLSRVFKTLQVDLTTDAYHALIYGETIDLYRCKTTQKPPHVVEIIEVTDMHPFLTFYVADFKPIKFNEDNEIIGFTTEDIDSYYSSESVDFKSDSTMELAKYLQLEITDIFKIMKKRGITGSNIERIPPTVGVVINLSTFPRNENSTQNLRFKGPILFKDYSLSIGENNLS